MANMFALILATATLITGIIWCLDKLKWAPQRKRKKAEIEAKLGGKVDSETLDKSLRTPGWIETGASVFPLLAFVFIVRSFIYEPFQIPSGSMMPTLLIGDFILVEKYAYGIKDPITLTTLIKTKLPQRGDIAVFKYPKEPQVDFIKRVIGLPGDRITYDPLNKTVTIKPACQSGKACQALPVTYTDIESSDFVQTFKSTSDGISGDGFWQIPQNEALSGGIRMASRQETIGKVTHNILLLNEMESKTSMYYRQPGQERSTWVVPAGHYFMMGDNRDNSSDGRFWGFVPEKNLVGKATGIWMSFEKQEGEWPTGVRLNRIGGIH